MLRLYQYVSAGLGYIPNEELAELDPHVTYNVYFQNNATGAAQELNADIRKSLRSCYQTAKSTIPADFLTENNTFLGPWNTFLQQHKLKQIPFSGLVSHALEDYLVEQYSIQGFYNSEFLACLLTSTRNGRILTWLHSFQWIPNREPILDLSLRRGAGKLHH